MTTHASTPKLSTRRFHLMYHSSHRLRYVLALLHALAIENTEGLPMKAMKRAYSAVEVTSGRVEEPKESLCGKRQRFKITLRRYDVYDFCNEVKNKARKKQGFVLHQLSSLSG